jgi:ribosomal 50S subunit-recycling heat shock protein
MLSDSLDAIEEMVLTKIKATIPLETDLMKLTKVLHVVNSAKRRSKGEGMPAAGNVTINNQQVVSLQLPKHLRKQVEYTTNPQNEVVEINGKCLSIASNKQVERLAGLSTDEEDNSNGQIHRQPSSPQPLLSRARNGQDNLGLSEEDFASATVIDSTTETYEAVKDS